jgi:hypothetical protein
MSRNRESGAIHSNRVAEVSSGRSSRKSDEGLKQQGAAGDRSPYADWFNERISVLADDQQDHKQGGDQNNVRSSVHVVQDAVDFFHLFSPGLG